jgi:outer membrane protein assembly factor BamD (BamD/ComL family)
LYQNTYRYELDQQPSHTAIAAIEEFLYDYPRSEYDEVCRKMLDDLYNRLDGRLSSLAKLYIPLEDYNAAYYALKETSKTIPKAGIAKMFLYFIVAAN